VDPPAARPQRDPDRAHALDGALRACPLPRSANRRPRRVEPVETWSCRWYADLLRPRITSYDERAPADAGAWGT